MCCKSVFSLSRAMERRGGDVTFKTEYGEERAALGAFGLREREVRAHLVDATSSPSTPSSFSMRRLLICKVKRGRRVRGGKGSCCFVF